MNTKKFCFCNVSFGERYVRTQQRLKESILKFYPNASLFFWTNEFPPNSRSHDQSCYGFKVHAIEKAKNMGFDTVIWIDTCAVLNNPIEPLFELTNGVFAVADEEKLAHHMSDDLLKFYNDVEVEWRLVGGSIYIFDFQSQLGGSIYESWKHLEKRGYFGNKELIFHEKNNGIDKKGHRMDETCLALCMYKQKVKPISVDVAHYDYQDKGDPKSIIIKKHFLNPGEKWYDK